MPENNTLKINRLPAAVINTRIIPKPVVGMPFARMRYLAGVAGDENAPHFDPSQEPLQDGRAYTAKDNHLYYRPLLRVAQRPGDLPGPDVRFLKDVDGNVRLQFSLEESPQSSLPAAAEPFNVKVDLVTLFWRDAQGQSRQRLFEQPTLVGTDNPQDSLQPNFVIRTGSELSTGEVDPIFQALSRVDSGAYLNVDLSFSYWIDEPQGGNVPPHVPGNIHPIGPGELHPIGPGELHPIGPGNIHPPIFHVHAGNISPNVLHNTYTPVAPAEGPPVFDQPDFEIKNKFNTFVLSDRIKMVIVAQHERQSKPNFHTSKLDLRLPFIFDASLQSNRWIYAALLSSYGLTEQWTDLPFGMVRTANFPNTVYRLPNEIRLAFDTNQGFPYMIPTVYRDSQENLRVRVTLGAMAWHDPYQLVDLRDKLRVASGGALAAPTVVIGGYESATLRLTSAFPEEIKTLDGQDVAISLENGFQVTLDLSLEFYRFLAQLLTLNTGLTGEVKVRLATLPPVGPGGTEQVLEKIVPVRLTFDALAGLPLEVKLPPEALSPRQVEISNPTPVEISLNECLPRLLQVDSNSITPLDVYEAQVTTPVFPATLAAKGTLNVDLKPKNEDPSWVWNAVQVEMAGLNLTQSPSQVLDHIHEVFPSCSLTQKLNVESPFFQQASLPDKFANLSHLKVNVYRPGFAVEQVVLSKDKVSDQVTLQRNLKEILGEQAGALATFKYKVQNVYYDHEGQWSADKDAEGTNIFVYPNPPESD
jgi:hypothetical protein